jgi:hypothetical protein
MQTENMECDMCPNCGIPQETLCPPPWGGNCVLRKLVHIKLINTCPIDNYLTIFYFHLMNHPTILDELRVSPENHMQSVL